MKKKVIVILTVLTALAVEASAQSIPKTIVLNGGTLEQRRREITSAPNSNIALASKALVRQANEIVAAAKTYSVMNKTVTPPSGDKHDYMSQAPYWWPDPAKPNGLPYIRKDGERNPELDKISDHDQLDRMLDDAERLALAYFFTNDEKYASHAAAVLRSWFLDAKTMQNPNLNFAQGIPGINTGRGIGLIETRLLYRAIDAAILLDGSRSWTTKDHEALKKWFEEYLKWMLESPLGKDEADERNNHGTYYDVQVVAYALFTEHRDSAIKQLETTKGRIATQIEPDGRQPHELARTLSWNYANMNLLGFFTLARLGESVGVDLWNYKTADGRGIKPAVEWLVPFVQTDKAWTYQQIKPRTYDLTDRLLKIASKKYQNPNYESLAKKLATGKQNEIEVLNLN